MYFKSFNALLKKALKKKQATNKNYSMRAFARDLGIRPSILSYYLRDERSPSPRSIKTLGIRLGLSERELKPYLVQAHEIDKEEEVFEQAYDGSFVAGNEDVFALASNFLHFAFLQCLSLPSFEPNLDWISKTLSLSSKESKVLFERLQRLGYLEVLKNGTWQVRAPAYMSNIRKNASVEANKLLQLQVLEFAILALKNQTYAEMDQTSIMFPVKKENLAKIKDRITVFRKQLAAEFNETDDPDEIYQFSFSCFPMTRK